MDNADRHGKSLPSRVARSLRRFMAGQASVDEVARSVVAHVLAHRPDDEVYGVLFGPDEPEKPWSDQERAKVQELVERITRLLGESDR